MTRPAGARPPGPRERLLLVGAGHSHLHVLLHATTLDEAGYDVTLVAPASFFYSGAAAAVATGRLPAAAAEVDVAALAARSGVRHLAGRLAAFDPLCGWGRTEDGDEVHWDVACLNLGSTTPWPADLQRPVGTDLSRTAILRAKPLDDLRRLVDLPCDARYPLVVIGGGASGVEIAAQLAVARSPHTAGVVLVEQGPWITPGFPEPSGDPMRAMLAMAGLGRGMHRHT